MLATQGTCTALADEMILNVKRQVTTDGVGGAVGGVGGLGVGGWWWCWEDKTKKGSS